MGEACSPAKPERFQSLVGESPETQSNVVSPCPLSAKKIVVEQIPPPPSGKDKEHLFPTNAARQRTSVLWSWNGKGPFRIRIVAQHVPKPISVERAIEKSIALVAASYEKNYSDPDDVILNQSLRPDIDDDTQVNLIARQRASADPLQKKAGEETFAYMVKQKPQEVANVLEGMREEIRETLPPELAKQVDRVGISLQFGAEELQGSVADVVAKSPLVIATTATTEPSRLFEFVNTRADNTIPVSRIDISVDEIDSSSGNRVVNTPVAINSDARVMEEGEASSPPAVSIASPPQADRSMTDRAFSSEPTMEASINSLPNELQAPVLAVIERAIETIRQAVPLASTDQQAFRPNPPQTSIVLEARPISSAGFEIRLAFKSKTTDQAISEHPLEERHVMESLKTALHKGFAAAGFSVEEPHKKERNDEASLVLFIFPAPSPVSLLRTEKMAKDSQIVGVVAKHEKSSPPVASRDYSDQGGEGERDSSHDEGRRQHQRQEQEEEDQPA